MKKKSLFYHIVYRIAGRRTIGRVQLIHNSYGIGNRYPYDYGRSPHRHC